MRTRSDDLQILLAVMDTGGFSSAAQALDIQVAKVSRAVARIEHQLGCSILNRTTRRVSVTEEGQFFVDAIRNAIQEIQLAEEELVSRGEKPKGKLRVDAASPFVLHQLVPLVQEFNQHYPNIELELTSNEGFVDLLEQRTDIAIRIGKLTDSTLHAKPLGNSLLYIVAAPGYLAQRGVPQTVHQLLKHQLIGFTAPRILNDWPLSGIGSIQPSIVSSSGETVRQLALSGNGIACLSGFMVKQDIDQGRLVALFENNKLTNTGREQVNAVYYRSSKVSKRISAFIDFIQSRLTL